MENKIYNMSDMNVTDELFIEDPQFSGTPQYMGPWFTRVPKYLLFISMASGTILSIALIVQLCYALRMIPKKAHTARVRHHYIFLLNIGVALLIESFFSNLFDGLWHSGHNWKGGNATCKLAIFIRFLGWISMPLCVTMATVAQVLHRICKDVSESPATYLRFILPVWIFSCAFSLFHISFAWAVQYGDVEFCHIAISDIKVRVFYFLNIQLVGHVVPFVVSVVFVTWGFLLKFRGCKRGVRDEELLPDQDSVALDDPSDSQPGKVDLSEKVEKLSRDSIASFVTAIIFFAIWMPLHFMIWSLVHLGRHGMVNHNLIVCMHVWYFVAIIANPIITIWLIVCVKFKL